MIRSRFVFGTMASVVALGACQQEVFEPDVANSLLPAYTETGNDVAGAYIEDEAWKTEQLSSWGNYDNGIRITGDDSLRIRFYGSVREGQRQGQGMHLTFVLPRVSRSPFTVDSLPGLHNRRFRLDGRRQYTTLYNAREYKKGRGELFVRRVQRKLDTSILVNGQYPVTYIVSGTFAFTAYAGADSLRVTEGRFDHAFRRPL